jgi:hypothetical protein
MTARAFFDLDRTVMTGASTMTRSAPSWMACETAALSQPRRRAVVAARARPGKIRQLFRLGGASAIYEPGVLQRCWRDINVCFSTSISVRTSMSSRPRASSAFPPTRPTSDHSPRITAGRRRIGSRRWSLGRRCRLPRWDVSCPVARARAACRVCPNSSCYPSGGMFALSRKKLVGSYLALSLTSRCHCSAL